MYKPKIQEEKYLAELMRTRWQHCRNSSSKKSRDVMKHNPLICITGADGTGKSALMSNFPVSPSYRSYLQERYPTVADPQPIVAMYTLDRMFSQELSEIGLRIVYGALTSMSMNETKLINDDYASFREKILSITNNSKLGELPFSAQDAVEMLWELFGKDRPILLLQDNPSTIKKHQGKAQGVVDSLHELVVKYDNIDVIMSTRTYKCTKQARPTTPQQHIKYVQLQPLPQLQEMVVLTRKWAKYIRDRYEADTGRAMNREVFRLLTGSYILTGYHPGTMTKLASWFKECMDEGKESFNVTDLVNADNLLCSDKWEIGFGKEHLFQKGLTYRIIQSITYSYLYNVAFTKKTKSIPLSGLYWSRFTRHKNSKFLYQVANYPWYAAIFPSELFKLQSQMSKGYYTSAELTRKTYPQVLDFMNIFINERGDCITLKNVLPKCVVLSILVTIRENKDIDLSTAFGCNFPVNKTIKQPVLAVPHSLDHERETFVVLPPDTQAGYSALLCLYESENSKPLYAYLAIPTPTAVAGEPQQDLSEVLVSAVKNILHAHSQLPAGAGVDFTLSSGGANPNKALLEQLYVVFYDARNPMESMALDYAALQEVALEQLTRAVAQGLQAQSPSVAEEVYLPVVLEFLQHHQGNLQVVTQPQLRDFLIPSFVPLMDLTNHVYGPEEL